MMMTSSPSFILMKPNTLKVINKILTFREQNKIDICYTLDAGPNIHMLYKANEEAIVKHFIKNDLEIFCENGKWIDDGIGKGPERLI